MSIENLDATVQVSEELRKHRLSQGKSKGEDVLRLPLTLWYTWKYLHPPLPDSKSKPAESAYDCPLCTEHKSFSKRNGVLDHL